VVISDILLILCIVVGQCHFENINENEERHTLSIVSYNRSTVRRLLFNLCDPIPRLSTKKEQRHASYVDRPKDHLMSIVQRRYLNPVSP